MSATQLFARGALLYPDRPCLQDAGGVRTYREVRQRVSRIAAHLNTGDEPTGEKCAVYCPNNRLALECLLGIQWAGAVYVPLNAKNPITDNVAVAQTCEVTTLFFHSGLAAEAQHLRAACPEIERLVCMDGPSDGAIDLGTWLRDGTCEQSLPVDFLPEEVVAIYSTGGTTGVPKGVMLTSLNWDIAAANFHAATTCDERAVFLAVSPITHAAGTFSLMLMAEGAKTVILPGFDPGQILDAIERERVTHLYLPPTAIYMLLDHPGVGGRDFSSLQYFIYTSAPMAVAKLRECLTVFGPVMIQFWGQTEAPSFCTVLTREDHLGLDGGGVRDKRLESCGRPMLLTPVAAMDDHGKLLPPGEKGELVVRGPLVMAGYYRNPEATAEVSTYGWHHTGDVGYLDEDGYTFIVDRKKDMIITGGYNVYPREVEAVLLSHPAIKECAVVGVPDAKWGEAVKGVIEFREGMSATDVELIAFCKQGLGSVKAPKSIEAWPELPRTPVGKLDKKRVRQHFWQGIQRAI